MPGSRPSALLTMAAKPSTHVASARRFTPTPPAASGSARSVAFSRNGACTNQAESYFSRLRRAEMGQHHHISGKYLLAYAAEMAWREDNRRVANGTQHEAAAGAALAHAVSRVLKGYWQRVAK